MVGMFGRWLAAQKDRADWIGDLARAAAKDARFPWSGGPLDMHARIRSAMGGDAEALHAFGAALDEWNGEPYSLADDALARQDAERRRARAAFEAGERAEEERRRLHRNALAAARRRAKSSLPA